MSGFLLTGSSLLRGLNMILDFEPVIRNDLFGKLVNRYLFRVADIHGPGKFFRMCSLP
jgi:hypothetical protein